MRRIALALLLSIVSVASVAQKGPLDELGFHADKVYDFSNVDAVNLFNGNVTISIPCTPQVAAMGKRESAVTTS